MKIEVFVLCYNEEKMIPFFLDHYLKFCDKITILDNYSIDGGMEIVESYNDDRIKVIKYDSSDKLNDQIYINLKNNIWKGSDSDYVIVVDMDEFLYHPNLIEFLNDTKSSIYKPVGYEMVSENFPNYGNPLIDTVKEGMFCDRYSKCCIFSPKIGEINYEVGAHGCSPRTKKGTLILPYEDKKLKLLHYKNLSYEYRLSRHEQYAKRYSDINKINGWSFHYAEDEKTQKRNFDLLMDNKSIIIS